jgi:hypothetical protein
MGKNDDVQRQMGSESLLRFRPSDKPIEHEAFPIPDIAGDFTPRRQVGSCWRWFAMVGSSSERQSAFKDVGDR